MTILQTTAGSPRVLILRGGALGDFILTLPAIRALRRHWPSAAIELIGHARIAELALIAGLVDRVRSLDASGMAEWFVPLRVWPESERNDIASFDFIVSYLGDPEGVVQANLRAAGAKQVIACSPVVAAGLPASKRLRQACHAGDRFMRPVMELIGQQSKLFYAGGCMATDCSCQSRRVTPLPQRIDERISCANNDIAVPIDTDPVLPWPAALRGQGRQWLNELGLTGDVIALHPGSGSSRKNWPAEKFVQLAEGIRQSGIGQPLFVLGEADAAASRALFRLAPAAPVMANRSLKEVASVLAVSRGYVGNDSGITHLAAALGIPVVALFGPTAAAVWRPRGAKTVVLQGREPTSPALAAIESPAVLKALERLVGA